MDHPRYRTMNSGLDDDDPDYLECRALEVFKSGIPLAAVSFTMLVNGECKLRDIREIDTFLSEWIQTKRRNGKW